MGDNEKEVRKLNSKEEKDVSGGVKVERKINTTMVAYGAPIIRPQLMKYGGPVIKPILPLENPSILPESNTSKGEELIPNNPENKQPEDK